MGEARSVGQVMSKSKMIFPFLMAGLMMDSVFGSHSLGRVYHTNNDPAPSPEIVNLIKQKAEKKRLRRMNKRKAKP